MSAVVTVWIYAPPPLVLTHLALRDEDAPECVKADWRAVACLTQPALQVKHGDARTEELREMMQQQQPVPQSHDGDLLQMIVLHRNLKNTTNLSGQEQKLKVTWICEASLPPAGGDEQDMRGEYLRRQFAGVSGFAGGPGQSVSRATGHSVDFFALQRGH